MTSHPIEQRLSNISTNWDELLDAHRGNGAERDLAILRGGILRRYSDCVYQYITGATNSHHEAEDLTQEFALRFVRGDYKNVNPQQGRFRDYLKQSLRNLITDRFRSKAAIANLETNVTLANAALQIDSLETLFVSQWRERTLSLVWASLKDFETKKNRYYDVLRLRADHPKATSESLATLFSQAYQKPVTSDWIRQNLRRARKKFSDLLIEEVSSALNTTSRAEIDEELISLGLLKYVDG